MNVYCRCGNKTTMENLDVGSMFYFAVNERGEVVRIGGIKCSTPVYRAEYNGEKVTVFSYNEVSHERNEEV